MSALLHKAHKTPKQIAAAKGNLAKARAKPRSAKQKAASRLNLVKARAAQKSRRKGKAPVKSRAAKAPVPDSLVLSGDLADGSRRAGFPEAPWILHQDPVCSAVALAESIWIQHGAIVLADDIAELTRIAGMTGLGSLLEAAAGHGLGGWRLAWAERADPGLLLPGMIYGITIPAGYHAVCLADVPVSRKIGMLSWGMLLPLAGEPQEAWLAGWEAPDGRDAA